VPVVMLAGRMNGKLPGLQIARLAAALGIAYFHSWHVTAPFPENTAYPIPILTEFGWIAVDFFFAISGFVICLVVVSDRFEPISFIIRRAFRLYSLWTLTSLVYLYLCNRYLGRSPEQTTSFFIYSLTLLPTNGFPFYDLGWSLQHEMLFYALAAVIAPLLGIEGVAVALAAGIVADHVFDLPWYLQQYFFYYGNFLAGVAVFFNLPPRSSAWVLVATDRRCHCVPMGAEPSVLPHSTIFLLLAFISLPATSWIGKIGVLLGDSSYSIYLIHPLVFYWVYAHLQPPLHQFGHKS
jgi:exopolysaccharide production protein ExoZ